MYTTRWDVACKWCSFSHRSLICFRYSTIEHDRPLDSIVIASDLFAVLFDKSKLVFKSGIIHVADVADIGVLSDLFECSSIGAPTDSSRNVGILHSSVQV